MGYIQYPRKEIHPHTLTDITHHSNNSSNSNKNIIIIIIISQVTLKAGQVLYVETDRVCGLRANASALIMQAI